MQTFLYSVGEVRQVEQHGQVCLGLHTYTHTQTHTHTHGADGFARSQACVVVKTFKNERSMLMAWQVPSIFPSPTANHPQTLNELSVLMGRCHPSFLLSLSLSLSLSFSLPYLLSLSLSLSIYV